ncbi:MAG: hypothetical protein WAW17_01085 [Rhodococcus sp. (in: high G+C Gram-positive bacteria)]
MSEQPSGAKLRFQMLLGKVLMKVYQVKMRFSRKQPSQDPAAPSAE